MSSIETSCLGSTGNKENDKEVELFIEIERSIVVYEFENTGWVIKLCEF